MDQREDVPFRWWNIMMRVPASLRLQEVLVVRLRVDQRVRLAVFFSQSGQHLLRALLPGCLLRNVLIWQKRKYQFLNAKKGFIIKHYNHYY